MAKQAYPIAFPQSWSPVLSAEPHKYDMLWMKHSRQENRLGHGRSARKVARYQRRAPRKHDSMAQHEVPSVIARLDMVCKLAGNVVSIPSNLMGIGKRQ